MPSNLKSETASRNGAKSRGPVTEEGKRESCLNAVKHGIHSTRVVLQHEDPEAYDRLLTAYVDQWRPATPTEEALVMDMVNARWRLQRIQELATAVIEREMEACKDRIGRRHQRMTSEAICARGLEYNVQNAKSLETFERWEGRLHRTYDRALKVLRSLQSERLAAAEAAAGEAAEEAKNEIVKTNPTASKRLGSSYLRRG